MRIILWKFFFEISHLCRLFSPQPDRKIHYFAFGANLSAEVLQKRRIRVFGNHDFVLEEAELNFSQPGFYKDHGYASADPAENSAVYGKMYLILESDARRMDFFEGVPFLRVHDKVVSSFNGTTFYYYRARRPQKGLLPTREYLDYITAAYESMSIVPKGYLNQLKETKVLSRLLARDDTRDFVEHINRWPHFLHPALIRYESICHQIVEFLWNRSLVQWMIPFNPAEARL
ncbi:MAG: gamma-glutamylcyclotransferase family protein [Pseudomonadota bacterium]